MWSAEIREHLINLAAVKHVFLKRIAERVATYTAIFVQGLRQMGYEITNQGAFDSVTVKTGDATNSIAERARQSCANLRFR